MSDISETDAARELIATALKVEKRLTALELKVSALIWLNGSVVGALLIVALMKLLG